MRQIKRLIHSLMWGEFISTPFITSPSVAIRILSGLSLFGFLAILIYTILWLLISPASYERALTFAIPYLSLLLVTYWLARRRRAWLGAVIYLLGSWIFFTAIVITSGGVFAPIFPMYSLLIVFVTLLLGLRIAYALALLTIGAGFVLAIVDQMGYIDGPVATPLQAWLTHTSIILLLMAGMYFILKNSVEAVRTAQKELAERQQIEQALRESEERFRLISSVTSDYTFSSRFNADGRMIHTMLTGAFEAISGYTPEEFIARGGWRSTIYPEDLAKDDRDMQTLLRNERVTSEIRIIRKDGAIRWVRIYALPVWDSVENRLLGVNGGVQDITEQKLYQEFLTTSEKRYRVISELISDYAYAYEILPDGSLAFDWVTEESFTRMTGYIWDEIGASFKLYHPEDLERVAQDVAQSVQGHPTSGEYRIITKNGELKWIHIQRQVEWDEAQQRYVRLYGAARNITEQKLASEALRRSERHLRALLDASTDVAFLMAKDGTFLTLNKTLAKFFGREVEELIGQPAMQLTNPALRAAREAHFRLAQESGRPVRWEDIADQSWWDNNVYPILTPEGTVEAFAVYSRDISEQKRLAIELQRYTIQLEQMVEERTAQLRRAKEQIEIILKNTRDAIALALPNGDIEVRNPAFIDLFGDQVARSIEQILNVVGLSEEVEPVGQALINVLMDANRQRFEMRIASQSGALRDIDLSLIPVRLEDDSNQQGVLVSAHDITHLKEIERFKARFVADAVHDIAAPISALKTRLYLLQRSPERLSEHVQALQNQVEHLRDLLADLRVLSQLDHGQIVLNREERDLRDLLQRIFYTYEPVAINKSQTLVLQMEPAPLDCWLDQRQIERAIVNLVSNAIKYSPPGAQTLIQTIREGDHACIQIIDQGMGISSEDLPNIFERFYRTQQARQSAIAGTGLGLAIAREIIEMHGGSISVESQLGQGTTFTVRLPIEPFSA